MKYAILGGYGLLGKAFQEVLQQSGKAFTAFSKQDLDIRDVADLGRLLPGFDVIINCAAYTDVKGAEIEQKTAYEVNVEGPRNLAAYTRSGPKLIHISSDYVFGGANQSRPYQENDDPDPLNIYGKTKALGEIAVLEENPAALVWRTSWLFSYTGQSFVQKILQQIEQKKEVSVVEDQVGRPTFAQDLAEAVLGLEDASGIFHFANKEPVSRYQFAEAIWLAAKNASISLRCKKMHSVKTKPTDVVRPSYSVLSTQKYAKLAKTPRSWKKPLEITMQKLFSLC